MLAGIWEVLLIRSEKEMIKTELQAVKECTASQPDDVTAADVENLRDVMATDVGIIKDDLYKELQGLHAQQEDVVESIEAFHKERKTLEDKIEEVTNDNYNVGHY